MGTVERREPTWRWECHGQCHWSPHTRPCPMSLGNPSSLCAANLYLRKSHIIWIPPTTRVLEIRMQISCFPCTQDKGYDTGSVGQRYHVKLSLISVDVTSGQSDWLWGWRLQGRAPNGEATWELTAVVVVVTANSGGLMVWWLGQACSVVWGIFPRSLASISFLQPSWWFCGRPNILYYIPLSA